MFILSDFIKTSLIDGVKNGSFTRERANILAVDYLAKGFLVLADLQEIDAATMPAKTNEAGYDGETADENEGSAEDGASER